MKKLLLTLLGVLIALPAFAQEFTYEYEGQTLTYTVIDEEAKTCKTREGNGWVPGNSVSGKLIIPSIAEDSDGTKYSVTSIGDRAFYNCSGLTSLTIPNSVTSIGDCAFSGCSGLTSLTIPNSVTSIGYDAFYHCSGLTNLIVKASTPPEISSIFEALYDNATLTIPAGSFLAYTSSGWYQFKSIKVVGESGEYECKTYNDGVLSYRLNPMDKSATVTGSNTTAITIPERFTDESDPANPVRYYVKAIGYKAFADKTIDSFEFNSRNKLEYVGDYAFRGSTLSAITLPETVTSIGDYAFYNCRRLTSMTIPNSVTSIGEYAFYRCDGLTKAEFASIESLCGIKFGGNDSNPLYYAHNLYIGGEEVKDLVIPNSVTSIGDYAFYNCYGLTSVTIGNSVNSIGCDAFYYCFSLTKAEFASIEALCGIKFGNYASNPLNEAEHLYIGGEEVKDLVIPNSVTSIGNYAFYNCYGLTSLTIPNSVTSIGEQAFRYCKGLTSLTIGNSVTSIGEEAFSCCSGLTSLNIPNSVTSIGNLAFYGCDGLTSIKLEDGNTGISIGTDAFSSVKPTKLYCGRPWESLKIGCSAVTDLTIGNCVEEIPAGSFRGATKLTSLKLGSGIKSIGENAFSGCSGLTEVIIPPAVETIGASAFAGDSELKSIIMGHSVKSIGEKAFDGCPASTVSITAAEPPVAPNNAFSSYSGKLYLVDQATADAYYDAYTCWDRFNSYIMVTPARLEGEQTQIQGKAGEQIQLTATLWPENVTLPQIFWRSTNPEVATVDDNGLVTLHIDINRSRGIEEGCKIIAETLYGSQLTFDVLDPQSGITEVIIDRENVSAGGIDYTAPYEIFNLNGQRVAGTLDTLTPGIYILRQGTAVEKHLVK